MLVSLPLRPLVRPLFGAFILLMPGSLALAAGGPPGPPAGTLPDARAAVADGTISGRITDAKGQALPGVTVVVEGTSLGGSTNAEGVFSISGVPAGEHTLVISFVGYSTVRQPFTSGAGQNPSVSVQLAENATALAEAVVVGYGTQSRQDVTGSVTSVTAKDFVKGQITSPEQLVQGKVAGVQITSGGGAPGEVSTIRIRGGASLNASNDPLVVIDGVPVDNQGINGAGSALTLVNPNDIESFTVLKDASATAIYGSRASNGVIIITTKKGVDGEKFHVNVSSQLSRATNYGRVPVLSGDAYRTLAQQAVAAGTIPSTINQYLGTANTDWQAAIYRPAWTTDNNVSVTGSFRHVPYRVSVGVLNQDGTLLTSNLERNTASVGLSPRLFDNHLRINLNLKGTKASYRFADQGAIGAAIRRNPTLPIYNTTGAFNGYQEYLDPANGTNPYSLTDRNPLALLNDKRDVSRVLRSIGNIQLDYSLHFLPDLHLNLNLGYDVSRSDGTVDIPASSSLAFVNKGAANRYHQEKDNKLLEAYANYTKQLGDHHLELLGGYSYQDFYTYSPFQFAYRADGSRLYPQDSMQNPYKSQYTLISFYGRLNYNYKNRYLLTATLRDDGSSHFREHWGLFPAASVAWRVKSESFLADAQGLSELKLRLSYGRTGQQDVTSVAGDYPYLGGYKREGTSVQQTFGTQNFYTLRPAAYDANLTWEKTTTYNAGLDYGFFDNRLTGSVDVYLRKTTDLLAVIPISAGSNFSNTLLTNIGDLENRGLEVALNYNVLKSERLSWSVNLNATFNRGRITKLSQVEDPNNLGTPTGSIGNFQFVQTNAVGHAPNSFFLYQQRYNDGKPVQGPTSTAVPAQYVDQNNDGIINERDKVYEHDPAPQAIFGFSSNLSYGKASLAFTVRSNVGNYVYNGVDAGQGNYYGLNTGLGYAANVVPSIYATNFKYGQPLSDIYLQNASFVRLQNVTLGYSFGNVFKGATLGVTLAGQNLLVLTNYTGLDPEMAFGVDTQFYPRPRTVTLGVNVGF